MRVLQVLGSVGPLRGGPSFVLRNLASGLAERGIETDVVTTDDNGPERLSVPLGKPVVEDGVTYRYFRRQTSFYTTSLPLTRWLWKNIGNYDLVHIHALFTYSSTVAAWIARTRRVPYIVRPLGILNQWGMRNRRRMVKKWSFAAVERGILQQATLVHYTSEQERVEAEMVGVKSPYMIVANPVDFHPGERERRLGKFRAAHPEVGGRPLVVFLSRIAPKKGLDLLIPAFARVLDRMPGAVLAVAGDGDAELMERVKKLICDSRIGHSVIWPGFLHGEDKAALLADADLFVLPSHSENFGVAAVEALCCGAPAIVSDQVGIHREIAKYGAGLVVPCEVAPLADAMVETLSNPGARAEMSANAMQLAAERFSRDRILDSLIGSYRKIAAKRIGHR